MCAQPGDVSSVNAGFSPSDLHAVALADLDAEGNGYSGTNPVCANLYIHGNTLACCHAMSHSDVW